MSSTFPPPGSSNPKHFRSGELSNISVRFSPFDATKLVLAQSANFGIVGSGQVSVMQNNPMGKGLQLVQAF